MKKFKKVTLNTFSRFLYIFGVAILFSGILLSTINVPASATHGENTPTPNSKINVCHWTEAQKFVSIEVSINSVDSIGDWGLNGHGNHEKDIYPSFTAKNGDVIPAAGDQSLLSTGCKVPTPTKTSTSTKTATVTTTNTPSSSFTPTATEDNSKKVQVCHWTEAEKYVSIEVSINSVASNADWGLNGHGNHEVDIWPQFVAKNGDVIPSYGDQNILSNGCEEPEATATPSPTVTNTSNPTNTATVSPTESDTPTNTATATLIPTSTGTVTETQTLTATPTDVLERLPLLPAFACYIQYMEWSITNPNSYSVTVAWEFDPSVVNAIGGINGKLLAPRALGFVAALSSGTITINPRETVVVTSSTPAAHVLKISYILQEGDGLTIDQTTNGSNFCVIN